MDELSFSYGPPALDAAGGFVLQLRGLRPRLHEHQ